MFRQLLEEAFEEFKQTVAPARPEVSYPPPVTTFRPPAPLPEPHLAGEMMHVDESERRTTPRPSRPVATAHPHGPTALRAQLSSPAQVRAAYRLMEILGPPVSLRDPLDRVQDR